MSARRVAQGINDTVKLLAAEGLLQGLNLAKLERNREWERVTWPNHVTGGHNTTTRFGQLSQFFHILEQGAYTCVLHDGSIVRCSYSFRDRILKQATLLWWPSPVPLEDDDFQHGGTLDMLQLYLDGKDWQNYIRMRSPLRLDFDVENGGEAHPVSHLHIQDANCRLYVDRPLCFGGFIRFVYAQFYPLHFRLSKALSSLEELKLDYEELPPCAARSPFLSWSR